MRSFILGAITGACFMGAAATLTATAIAAGGFGTGYMTGWTVTNLDGEEICSDPFMWSGIRTIECD